MGRKEPDNLKAFSFLTLAIFDRLYEAFPERVDIRGSQFVVETVLKIGSDRRESRYVILLPQTMAWLQEEGFIKWLGTPMGGNYSQVTLTLKAFTALGYVPTAIDGAEEETIIDRAKRVLSEGAEGAASDVVTAIFARAFGMATRYLTKNAL